MPWNRITLPAYTVLIWKVLYFAFFLISPYGFLDPTRNLHSDTLLRSRELTIGRTIEQRKSLYTLVNS